MTGVLRIRTLALLLLLVPLCISLIIVPAAASVPQASFVSNLSSGKAPLTIQFMDTSTNSPTGWIWSFGDGETSNAQNPVHTYTRTGTYPVTLAATNAQGSNTVTMSGYVSVGPPVLVPAAGFVSNVTSGTIPVTVQFLDTSANSPTSLVWSFGDGSTSSGPSPSHMYTVPGVYDVTLTASNAAGSNTVTRSRYITAGAPSADVPSAWFVSTSTGGNVPLTVQFVDASTNFPVSWAWSFGDGETSSLQNPLHTYSRAGTYNVTLTSTNSWGSHTISRDNYITAGSGIPGASFSATPMSGIAPLSVQFTDTSTNSPGAWSWAFGDGNVSSEQNPVYTYRIPGTYSVSLSATNLAGTGSLTRSGLITVTARSLPAASFTSDVRTGTAPLTVCFTDTSTNSPDAWAWSFGDGAISAVQNPSHTYMNPGSYTVTLVASNNAGSNTSSVQNYLVVSGSPYVAASGTPVQMPSVTSTYVMSPTSPGFAGSTAAESAGSVISSPMVMPGEFPLVAIIVLLIAAGLIIIWYRTRTPKAPRRRGGR